MEKVGGGLLETGVRGGCSRRGGGSGGRRRTPDTAVGETAALPGERIHDTPGPGTTLRGVSTQPGEKERRKTLTQRPFEQHCAPGLHYTESAPSPPSPTLHRREVHTHPPAQHSRPIWHWLPPEQQWCVPRSIQDLLAQHHRPGSQQPVPQ